MDAESYITGHWGPKEVFRNLQSPRHIGRFKEIVRVVDTLSGDADILGKILDYGCAFGHSTHMMRGMSGYDWLEWVGTDESGTALDLAKGFSPDDSPIKFVDPYGIEPQEYDIVVCSEVIEHVEDPVAFLKTLWSITAKAIVLTTPARKVVDPGHLRLYTADSLRRDIKAAIPDCEVEIWRKDIFLFAKVTR